MTFTTENGIETLRFDGIGALIDAAYSGKFHCDSNRDKWQRAMEREAGTRNSWPAGYAPERIRRELVQPPGNSAKVREISASIELHNETQRKRRKMVFRREDGEELDADAWLRREPNGWQRMEKTAESRHVLRVAVNASVDCHRMPEDLYYRGAAAVALVDALENAGHSVELVLFCCLSNLYVKDTRKKALVEVKVKDSASPLDIDGVALAVGEIGFFRRGLLPVLYTCGLRKVTGFTGYPASLPDSVAQGFDVVFDSNIYTMGDALAVVKRYAAQFEAGHVAGQ